MIKCVCNIFLTEGSVRLRHVGHIDIFNIYLIQNIQDVGQGLIVYYIIIIIIVHLVHGSNIK